MSGKFSPASILYDAQGNPVTVIDDNGVFRVSVTGKFIQGANPPPAGATPIQLVNDTPLSISGTSEVEYLIPNSKAFYLQRIIAGAGGDPTERGSAIELIYRVGAVDEIIQRIYVAGFTQDVFYSNQGKTRPGTAIVGDGATKKLVLCRRRLSGSSQEVDAVVEGYIV